MSDIKDEPSSPTVLLPCTVCSRTFRPEVLDRHVRVCEKQAGKKRRVFDSFKTRVSGTELEEFLGPAPLPGQPPKRPSKSPVKKKNSSKWKETHQNLIAVLRAARGAQPLPEIASEATKHGGNEQCPSCNRFFGPRAFDRHVEFCKEKTARIKMTPSKISQAQERLEARTKYRAPLSVKPKLTTKEKYSPMLPRKESTETCTVPAATSATSKSSPAPPSSRNAKPVLQVSSKKSNVSRSTERQRSVSPTKKNLVSNPKPNAKNELPTNKSSYQPKIKDNLRDSETLRPKTGTKNASQEKNRSSNLKVSQLEDEISTKLTKSKLSKNQKESAISKFSFPSDDESVATVESENCENQAKNQARKARSKWSSSESVAKNCQKSKMAEKKCSDEEKSALRSDLEREKVRAKEGMKHAAKSKGRSQRQQINDLSVNDESFGIVVAAYGSRRPSSSTISRSPAKPDRARDSPEKPNRQIGKREERSRHSDEEEKRRQQQGGKTVKTVQGENSPLKKLECLVSPDEKVKSCDRRETSDPVPDEIGTRKPEKLANSKIPKPKPETAAIKPEKGILLSGCVEIASGSVEPEIEKNVSSESNLENSGGEVSSEAETIKKKSRKWRNISEMTTEDLSRMTEDFDVAADFNVAEDLDSQNLSESAIWEIAAEQFLKSEESINSITSVDSLNEVDPKKESVVIGSGKNEDDFIVLHVTDPAKLDENDADMKLSMSEPCFPCSGRRIGKSVEIEKRADCFVFEALPNEFKRLKKKRKLRRRVKRNSAAPKMSKIREKTFLANDLPKQKRRKMMDESEGRGKTRWQIGNFDESSPENFPGREEHHERRMDFSKNPTDGVWAREMRSKFPSESGRSVEERIGDGKERGNLSDENKMREKFRGKEWEEERIGFREGKTEFFRFDEKSSPNKKFDYFEIDLEKDFDSVENSKNDSKRREPETTGKIRGKAETSKPEEIHLGNFDFSEREEEEREKETGKPMEDEGDEKDVEFFVREVRIEEEKSGTIRTKKKKKIDSDRNRTSTPKKNPKESENLDGEALGERKNERREEEAWENGGKCEDLTEMDSLQQVFNNQNGSSLDNIEEEDEGQENEEEVVEEEEEEEKTDVAEERKVGGEAEDVGAGGKSEIEIEDFIVAKPNAKKLLSKGENCLDQLFPRKPEIRKMEPEAMGESATAIKLDFVANSVYDLKSNGERNLKDFSRTTTTTTTTTSTGARSGGSRMLQKRFKRGSQLPQIRGKSEEKKENSMISLIELWKSKRENSEGGEAKSFRGKTILPAGKLAPLSIKNSFQIGDLSDPFKKAERQMMALLSWPSSTDIKSSLDVPAKSKETDSPSPPMMTDRKFSSGRGQPGKNSKAPAGARKNLMESFEKENPIRIRQEGRMEKPNYEAADDWEQIFEKHFDFNRNETKKMEKASANSVKSALDGLPGTGDRGKSAFRETGKTSPMGGKDPQGDNSIIGEILYTSTPKPIWKVRPKKERADVAAEDGSDRGRIGPPEGFVGDGGGSGEGGRDDGGGKKKRNSAGLGLMSGLSFCSEFSETTLADDVEAMRTSLEIVEKAAAAAISRAPRRKYARSQSVFEERNRMLFAKTYDPNFSSSSSTSSASSASSSSCHDDFEKEEKKMNSQNYSHPKSVASSRSFRSQSVFESDCRGDGDHVDDGDQIVTSPKGNRNRKAAAKLSGDSAYSSLNRRSPRPNPSKNVPADEDRLSSSGSENSFPIPGSDYEKKKSGCGKSAVSKEQQQKQEQQQQQQQQLPVKMSKFCHECGSKYPVAAAKFCCECGVRRLII